SSMNAHLHAHAHHHTLPQALGPVVMAACCLAIARTCILTPLGPAEGRFLLSGALATPQKENDAHDRSADSPRVALKGRMEEETLEFLAGCGLRVDKRNPRQYTATLPALPGVLVLFQRARDIPISVAAGDVDLGITGYDALAETADP